MIDKAEILRLVNALVALEREHAETPASEGHAEQLRELHHRIRTKDKELERALELLPQSKPYLMINEDNEIIYVHAETLGSPEDFAEVFPNLMAHLERYGTSLALDGVDVGRFVTHVRRPPTGVPAGD